MEFVPVIDVSRILEAETLEAIDQACREWGFFQVTGHGIDDDLTEALQREMRGFFEQPLETKRMSQRSADNPWGFYDRELTKNTRDWKQIFDCGQPTDAQGPTPWPESLPNFRSAAEAFTQECDTLAVRLLAAIAVNLGMPARALDGDFRPQHTSFLRLNYYPECPSPAYPSGLETPRSGHLGVNHHTDAGALTVLLQDAQPGLEVFRQDRWHLVEPRSDALVINIGDIVQVWSNDRYPAAIHRVVAARDRERFSAPYFFNPTYEAEYAPLPTTVTQASPARYRPIGWGEFRTLRAAGDYTDGGDEVQVDDYRIPNPAQDA